MSIQSELARLLAMNPADVAGEFDTLDVCTARDDLMAAHVSVQDGDDNYEALSHDALIVRVYEARMASEPHSGGFDETALSAILAAWCTAQGLPQHDAESLRDSIATNDDERTWLDAFIDVWTRVVPS